MLVDHGQVYIMKTPNVNIIVCIKQVIYFKILKQLIEQRKAPSINISPQTLYPLVVSAFA